MQNGTYRRVVLNCLHRSHLGGSQSRAAWCARPLRGRGWETIVVYPEDNEQEYAAYLADEGVRFERLPFGYLRSLKHWADNLAFLLGLPGDVWRFVQIMRRERIAVVHVNGMTNVQPVLAARIVRIPVVWQWNDMLTPAVFGKLVRPLLRHDRVELVVVARGILEKYDLFQVKQKTVAVWPEPFRPPPELHASAEDARREGQKRRRIGFVSNLVEGKGILDFLAAAEEVLTEEPDMEALVVGARFQSQPKFAEKLDKTVTKLKCKERIHFLGYRRDIYNVLSHIDCFVFPSHTEACPIVILEAMYSGVPIVATDVGEVGEMLADCGAPVVAVGDTCGLVSGIRAMLALSPESRRDLAVKMHARAVSRYGLERVVDLHCEAYERALAYR